MKRGFNREFVRAVQAAKEAGQTIDDVASSWKIPERFLKDGYLSPEQYEKAMQRPLAARLRTNAEVVWNETK